MGPERRGRAVHGRLEVNPSGEEPTDRPRQKNAGLWEPYDGRLSRTVLREREGEVPSRHSPGRKILKAPVGAPVAKAFAERWIGSIRREILDRTIIWNQRQLEHLVIDYIDHYNQHRPHRCLNQRPPMAPAPSLDTHPHQLQVTKSTRCDGLINEYRLAA